MTTAPAGAHKADAENPPIDIKPEPVTPEPEALGTPVVLGGSPTR